MSGTPLITVIVPCYKVEQYLPYCIESILNQTYDNLEILLVDDGSPDRCGLICDEYATKDKRITVIHKENGGVSEARNAALDIAKGEYIACVDGDDSIYEDYIETMYNLITTHNCQMALTNFVFDYEGNCSRDEREKYDIIQMTPAEAVDDLFYQKHFDDYPWCKLYKRTLFEGIRYPLGIIFEDTYVTYQLILKCNSIIYTEKQVYKYLIRSNSYEGAPFSKLKMDSAIKVFDQLEGDMNHRLINHQKSVSCRMFALACHLLMKCPQGYEKDLLWDKIKKYRRGVLQDRNAGIRTRIACLLSYAGVNIMKMCFRLVDKRK